MNTVSELQFVLFLVLVSVLAAMSSLEPDCAPFFSPQHSLHFAHSHALHGCLVNLCDDVPDVDHAWPYAQQG